MENTEKNMNKAEETLTKELESLSNEELHEFFKFFYKMNHAQGNMITQDYFEEFLEMSYAAGMDVSGTQIQEQMRTLERNKKMLKIIESAINILRERHVDGEEYYWILYYTYLSEKPFKSIEAIIHMIGQKTNSMTWKTYFKKRNKAINELSTILWGFTSKECLPILNDFII